MNPFTAHPQQQGISYIEHWLFAMGIAWRLLSSVVAFALHASLPFIDIAKRHDLEATMAFLKERNEWIETEKASAKVYLVPEVRSSRVMSSRPMSLRPGPVPVSINLALRGGVPMQEQT